MFPTWLGKLSYLAWQTFLPGLATFPTWLGNFSYLAWQTCSLKTICIINRLYLFPTWVGKVPYLGWQSSLPGLANGFWQLLIFQGLQGHFWALQVFLTSFFTSLSTPYFFYKFFYTPAREGVSLRSTQQPGHQGACPRLVRPLLPTAPLQGGAPVCPAVPLDVYGYRQGRILLQALHQMRIARRGARIGMPQHVLHGAQIARVFVGQCRRRMP